MADFNLFIYSFIFLLLLGGTDRALAVQEWNILALRVDFPLEEPDQLTTTGTGAFDLRSFANASPDYFFPYDTPPHDRLYFENHLEALARYYQVVSAGEVEIRFEVFPRELNQAYTLPEPALDYGNGRTPEEAPEDRGAERCSVHCAGRFRLPRAPARTRSHTGYGTTTVRHR